MSLIELPTMIAQLSFIIIPILMIGLSFAIIKMSDIDSASRLRRFFAHLRRPIVLKSIDDEHLSQFPNDEKKKHLKEQLGLRLTVFYLALGVFLLSSIIGTFYHIMGDVFMEIGQGSSDAIRTWSTIVIVTPFTGGWLGDFPWYGSFGLPPIGVGTFHDTWSWLFFVASGTDNPGFVSGIFPDMLIIPMLYGLIFLLPFVRRSFREAFVPSLFLFTTGMLTITSSVFRCFARAVSLEFYSGSIQFGTYAVTQADMYGLTMEMIVILVPVILVLFLIFLPMGWKLAKTHYPNNTKARNLFLIFTIGTYWISFFSIILMGLIA